MCGSVSLAETAVGGLVTNANLFGIQQEHFAIL